MRHLEQIAIGSSTNSTKTISAPYSVSTSTPRFAARRAALSHRDRDRRADADRRELHHDADELEHHLAQLSQNESMNVFAGALHLRQRDGEDDGEEDDLQHLVLRARLEEALRHRVLDDARERRLRLRELGAASVASAARFTPTPGFTSSRRAARPQRERRHDLEVDDRPERERPTRFMSSRASNADVERREEQWHVSDLIIRRKIVDST
jgi:hypothetical protein